MCNLVPGSFECMWATRAYTCPAANRGSKICIKADGNTALTREYIANAPRSAQQQPSGVVTLTPQQQQARIAIADFSDDD